MSLARTIEKKKRGADPAGFDRLKREGIGLIQELSGEKWTDFNLHDPGVTILDQLCYALTDLIYRTDFKVEDYLTDAAGRLDLEKQSLHPPERIFPCRPTTLNDYRKIIFDSVSAIENVWLRPADGPYRGCYRMALQLKPEIGEKGRSEIIDQVRRVYAGHRNLCEDLEEILFVREIDCEMTAEIGVMGERNPAEVLAEIYYRCSKYFESGISVYPFKEALKEGMSLEEIFTGPFTRHGMIKEEELEENRNEVFITDLYSIIKAVEGVQQIKSLSFEEKVGKEGDSNRRDEWPPSARRLLIPHERGDLKIKLIHGGKTLPVSIQEVRTGINKLNFRHQSLRHALPDLSTLRLPPRGEFRDQRRYYSIQNHFPSIYGINAYGVPDAAPPAEKARVAQLKGYLLLFEQIMANYAAGLDALRILFSTQVPSQTYFFQALGNETIPEIEKMYGKTPSEILEPLLRKYDRHAERKSRLLDYLLALYGESFAQISLRHFADEPDPDRQEETIVHNKIALLNSIVEMNRDRAGGFNDLEISWNSASNTSGLQRKAGLLLGLKYVQTRSLTGVFVERELELVSDDQFKRAKEGTVALEFVDLSDLEDRIEREFREILLVAAPFPGLPEGSPRMDDRRLMNEIVFLKNNVIGESILRKGIHLDKYRVGSMGAEGRFQLVFRPDETAQWLHLASYPTEGEAIDSADHLRRFLLKLNRESEGLHLVEHLLLRPDGKAAHEGISFPEGEDFFSFKLSVIFPSWTARFADKEFKKLAEETVRSNCPAHLYPEFYWIPFGKMYEFELLHKNWLDLKCDRTAGSVSLNAAARALILFLLENRHKKPS